MSRIVTAARTQERNGRLVSRWKMRTERDVHKFWHQFRRVPVMARRSSRDEKRYCLALYLFVLATHSRLRFPFFIEEDRLAEFRLPSGSTEITLAIAKANQIWEPQLKTDDPDWLSLVRHAIEEKLRFIAHLDSAARHDLLVYQDMPVPEAERATGLSTLRTWLQSLKRANPGLGRVSMIFSLDVVLDTGREFRNLEYIDWSNPDAFPDFGERVEFEGQKATVTAIRRHLREGRPTSSMDRRGRMLKRMPNGRLLEVSREEIAHQPMEAIKSG
jgi:hypothetical protein